MAQDYGPPRFSAVPWLVDSADLRPMGPPESSVEVGLTELSLGLYIPRPFGKETDAMLCIHAKAGNGNDGGVITLAITDIIFKREEPKPKKTTKKFYTADGTSIDSGGD